MEARLRGRGFAWRMSSCAIHPRHSSFVVTRLGWSGTLLLVAPHSSGGIAGAAQTAATRRGSTTRAGTGIAQPARACNRYAGSAGGSKTCSPSPTSTWSSPSPRSCTPGFAAAPASPTRRSSQLLPRPWWPSVAPTSEPLQASSVSCTPGLRPCCSIRTSIASSRAVGSHSTASAGSPPGRTSSCRCAGFPSSSAPSCSRRWSSAPGLPRRREVGRLLQEANGRS